MWFAHSQALQIAMQPSQLPSSSSPVRWFAHEKFPFRNLASTWRDSPTPGQESNAVYGDDKESIDFQKVVDLALHYSGSNAKATGSWAGIFRKLIFRKITKFLERLFPYAHGRI